MKALCWQGKEKVGVEKVPDPKILNPRDAILKITLSAICGSDLHLYDGYIPSMESGDILGHEFMGEVVEVGAKVRNLKKGDRVVVPFAIACGNCYFCKNEMFSACDNSNPNAWLCEKMNGYTGAGLFGYSHMYGGYAGGQAQYVRVPFADFGPVKIENDLPDEKLLFLTDIFPTGYMAAENCNIQGGETIAIWGCGPVGYFAVKSAFLLGAKRVIAIDQVPERLRLAREAGAEVLDFSETGDVIEELKERTGGMGPDACIDAVGMEADGHTVPALYDSLKQKLRLTFDRSNVLRQTIQACRKAGVVSVPGVYGGLLDKFNFGAAFAKGLTFKMGQTHMQKYVRPLLDRVEKGELDLSRVISHTVAIDEVPKMYKVFRDKQDHCTKVVIDPWKKAA